MSSQVSPAYMQSQRQADEPYIPVEELAQRLDLPLAILLRRIEAGDVPARRVVGGGGSGWGLRLSDLGIEPEGAEEGEHGGHHPPEAQDTGAAAVRGAAEPAPAAPTSVEPPPQAEPQPSAADGVDVPAARAPSAETPPGDDGSLEPFTMLSGRVTRYERGTRGVRGEVAGMLIDSRELVSGLLDRWERSLEQRIFVEQRQRFESELNARQNLVKQLQLELQAARAEHAAYAADHDRRRAELERQLEDLQRELAAVVEESGKRRGLFHRR